MLDWILEPEPVDRADRARLFDETVAAFMRGASVPDDELLRGGRKRGHRLGRRAQQGVQGVGRAARLSVLIGRGVRARR